MTHEPKPPTAQETLDRVRDRMSYFVGVLADKFPPFVVAHYAIGAAVMLLIEQTGSADAAKAMLRQHLGALDQIEPTNAPAGAVMQ